MMPISRITVWENSRRIGILNEFLATYGVYLSGTEYGRLSEDPDETSDAREARSKINKMTESVSQIVHAAGHPPVLHWSPPPMIGGRSMNIDMILNLFRLHRYQISPQEVFDAVERAGGVYEANHSKALRRTFNPFFWIGCLFTWIASIPFRFLEHIGLNGGRVEASVFGKIFKGIVELTAGIATICGALKLFGWFHPLLKLLGVQP